MKYLFLILIITTMVACSKRELPNGILSKESMTTVLIQIHLLEGKVKRLTMPADTVKLVYDYYEAQLFDSLNIDKAQYEESYHYHLYTVNGMEEIYAAVVDSLNLRKTISNVD